MGKTTRVSGDAVIVGGGHHGLVAATVLADAGWEVCLLEAAEEVGGAVRSVLRPAGYVTDLYSAFYPLSAVSPVLRSLRLAEHGLRWSHASVVLAHPPGRRLTPLPCCTGIRRTPPPGWPPSTPPTARPGWNRDRCAAQRRLRLAAGDAGPGRRLPGAGRRGR
jgi:protoporphyrinogen oxidase